MAEDTFFKYWTAEELSHGPEWLKNSKRRHNARMRAIEESHTRGELTQMRAAQEAKMMARKRAERERERVSNLECTKAGRMILKVERFKASCKAIDTLARERMYTDVDKRMCVAECIAGHLGQNDRRANHRILGVMKSHGIRATCLGVVSLLEEGVCKTNAFKWLDHRASLQIVEEAVTDVVS